MLAKHGKGTQMNAPEREFITTMHMTATGVSSERTDVRVRGIELTIDEPPERGGANAGATPPETLLAALAGCTNRISHKIAQARGIQIADMTIEVEAAFDRRGVNLEKDVEIPLTRVNLVIELTTDADAQAIAA
jgi:uncharacterized OsmC-like protein